MGPGAVKARVWEILEPARPGDTVSWWFDVAIRTLIAVNVAAVVVETVPEVRATAGAALHVLEVASVAVFSVEYVARIWSSTASPRYTGAVVGRLRFALTPLALVDLLAVLPAYLAGPGVDLRMLRGARLFRLFRILKLARYSEALRTMGRVFRRKRAELLVTASLVGFVLLVASTVLYYAEHGAQPEVFSSIPEAMWWGVVTLTTVGYGDVYPVTTLGRVMGGLFAVAALLTVALPTAILGAGFVEEMEGEDGRGARGCPHRPPPDGGCSAR